MKIPIHYTTPAVPRASDSFTGNQNPVASRPGRSDTVSISQAGREKLNLSKNSDTRIPGDKEWAARIELLIANDKKFADLWAKQNCGVGLTSAELDYLEKKSDLPNTMAFLSTDERRLYDELITKGNRDAADGISAIAHIRFGGLIGGESRVAYDPNNTAITPENIRRFFMGSILDPYGVIQSRLQTLANYMEGRTIVPEQSVA